MLIKSKFKPPDAPLRPSVSNITKNSAVVMWMQPISDGGLPITGYILERREKFSPHWQKVGRRLIEECRYKLNNLDEGQEYEFRVNTMHNIF